MVKRCPFNHDECGDFCALFISPDELNELVANRLTSIGAFDKNHGLCSLKSVALVQSRTLFEKTSVNKF